jgi:vitamin B12/bleomycin/antimicrobial peptide transport system ATP-binding/permease protein
MHDHMDDPVPAKEAKLDREFFRRWWAIARTYWTAKESRKQALGYFAILLAFLFATTFLNGKLNDYVRVLYTALAKQQESVFWAYLPYLIGLFGVACPAMVMKAFFRDRAALSWRISMTKDFMHRWLSWRAFYHINDNKEVDNPDERIAQDPDHVAGGTLVFLMLGAYALFNLCWFTPLLAGYAWWLPVAGLAWAVFGTIVTKLMGNKLLNINYNQRRLEADFRSGLIGVRTNTQSIAFYGGEEQEEKRLLSRFGSVVDNSLLLIRKQRNLQFLVQSYEYVNTLIPMCCIGPLIIWGKLEPGAMQSASQAFGIVMGSLSILVSQFKTLADLGADVNRLYDFDLVLKRYEGDKSLSAPENLVEGKTLAFRDASIVVPKTGQVLVEHFNLELKPGEFVLVVGPSGAGKSSTLRTGCGLWPSPTGEIEHPAKGKLFLIPQDTYLFEGTLREQLLYPALHREVSNEEILRVLDRVNLRSLLECEEVEASDPSKAKRVLELCRLDEVAKWQDRLSGGQKQRVSFARLWLHNPDIAVLDEPTSNIDESNEKSIFLDLRRSGKTVLTVAHSPTLIPFHDRVVRLDGKRGYTDMPVAEYIEWRKQQAVDDTDE